MQLSWKTYCICNFTIMHSGAIRQIRVGSQYRRKGRAEGISSPLPPHLHQHHGLDVKSMILQNHSNRAPSPNFSNVRALAIHTMLSESRPPTPDDGEHRIRSNPVTWPDVYRMRSAELRHASRRSSLRQECSLPSAHRQARAVVRDSSEASPWSLAHISSGHPGPFLGRNRARRAANWRQSRRHRATIAAARHERRAAPSPVTNL